MTKFTVQENSSISSCVIRCGDKTMAIVPCSKVAGKISQEVKDRANLMAAAPELYDALQEMLIAGCEEETKTLAHRIAHTKANEVIDELYQKYCTNE